MIKALFQSLMKILWEEKLVLSTPKVLKDTIPSRKIFIIKRNIKSNFIKALKENSHNLFAGTKYHLRKEFFDQEIDVLFIDEASQVSVADVVAMGKCAKNIVLVGDQQQLAMPSRAVHPGKINKSILEFLVEDDTISVSYTHLTLPTKA